MGNKADLPIYVSLCRTVYEKLAQTLSDETKELYLQRVDELSPNIRYCAYNLGDESAKDDLSKIRSKAGTEDPMAARLDVRLQIILFVYSAPLGFLNQIMLWAGAAPNK